MATSGFHCKTEHRLLTGSVKLQGYKFELDSKKGRKVICIPSQPDKANTLRLASASLYPKQLTSQNKPKKEKGKTISNFSPNTVEPYISLKFFIFPHQSFHYMKLMQIYVELWHSKIQMKFHLVLQIHCPAKCGSKLDQRVAKQKNEKSHQTSKNFTDT